MKEALSNQVDQTRKSGQVRSGGPCIGHSRAGTVGRYMNKVATMAEMETIHGLNRMNPPLLKAGLAIATNECPDY